jgi:hypothetical protein
MFYFIELVGAMYWFIFVHLQNIKINLTLF